MILVLEIVRLLIDVSMWLVCARLVVLLLVRREDNPFWQVVAFATEPVYRPARALTAGRLVDPWLGLVALVGLGLLRVPVALFLRHAAA